MADHYVPIYNLPDEHAAAQIREHGIDILVDLSGHTSGNRMMLFARKPAPVQLTWLGYPATTGLPTIDGRITDAVADPPGDADRLHTERLIRLDGGFLCYRPYDKAGAVAPLPARGAGHVTFGSFNNRAKLSPRTIALWAEIMGQVPDARLLLKATQFKDAGTRERCREAFVAAGVAGERIEILAPLPDAGEHLALYGRVDIALDPLVYNGTTTTCEALWMGVPVVTLRGDRHAARVGASILTTTGLASLIAETPDRYVAIATRLAGDLDALAQLRAGMRERLRKSPLCDAAGFARAMERAYREAWQRWCAAQAAAASAPAAPAASDGAQPPEAIEARARQLLDAKKLDEAEAMLRALTARAPDRATAWFLLGRVRHAAGDLDAAIDFLRKAIALDPRLAAAHSDLGIFLQGRGQLAEAEACYRRAIELVPNFAAAMSNLGAVLAERGRLEEASGWYSRAIAERADFPDAHNNLGATLVKLDRVEEAEALHRRAIALKPDFADAHYNLGVALHGQGRFDEALASYDGGGAPQPRLRRRALEPRLPAADDGPLRRRLARARMALAAQASAAAQLSAAAVEGRADRPGAPSCCTTSRAPATRCSSCATRRWSRRAARACCCRCSGRWRAWSARRSTAASRCWRKATCCRRSTCTAPLLSLPLAFATTLENIPARIPYLAADAAAAARWRARIGHRAGTEGRAGVGRQRPAQERPQSVDRARTPAAADRCGQGAVVLAPGRRARRRSGARRTRQGRRTWRIASSTSPKPRLRSTISTW